MKTTYTLLIATAVGGAIVIAILIDLIIKMIPNLTF